jgi:uncharacterized protein
VDLERFSESNYTDAPDMPTMNLIKVFFVSITLSFAIAQAEEGQTPVCPRDDAGFATVQKKADAKDPAAQTTLASCYDLGMHVQPNGRESIRLLAEAANQGYVPAEYELGRIYLYGRGVPADYAQALIWESKAAEQGDSRAQRDMAFLYERGFGVSADPIQAAEWNRKAAAQGNAEAQLQLAKALEDGLGVDKDAGEARKWYAKAANQEQPEAQLEMARAAAREGNCPAEKYWYEQAAEHGQQQAMYALGQIYLNSKCGVDRNKAYIWFAIGARLGSEESKKEADKFELTVGQKRRNLRRVEEWIKEHPANDNEEEDEDKK